jgi:hypothetical protein
MVYRRVFQAYSKGWFTREFPSSDNWWAWPCLSFAHTHSLTVSMSRVRLVWLFCLHQALGCLPYSGTATHVQGSLAEHSKDAMGDLLKVMGECWRFWKIRYHCWMHGLKVCVSLINSFNPRLEQTTSSVHIFSKSKEWMGKCLKESYSYYHRDNVSSIFFSECVVRFSRCHGQKSNFASPAEARGAVWKNCVAVLLNSVIFHT